MVNLIQVDPDALRDDVLELGEMVEAKAHKSIREDMRNGMDKLFQKYGLGSRPSDKPSTPRPVAATDSPNVEKRTNKEGPAAPSTLDSDKQGPTPRNDPKASRNSEKAVGEDEGRAPAAHEPGPPVTASSSPEPTGRDETDPVPQQQQTSGEGRESANGGTRTDTASGPPGSQPQKTLPVGATKGRKDVETYTRASLESSLGLGHRQVGRFRNDARAKLEEEYGIVFDKKLVEFTEKEKDGMALVYIALWKERYPQKPAMTENQATYMLKFQLDDASRNIQRDLEKKAREEAEAKGVPPPPKRKRGRPKKAESEKKTPTTRKAGARLGGGKKKSDGKEDGAATPKGRSNSLVDSEDEEDVEREIFGGDGDQVQRRTVEGFDNGCLYVIFAGVSAYHGTDVVKVPRWAGTSYRGWFQWTRTHVPHWAAGQVMGHTLIYLHCSNKWLPLMSESQFAGFQKEAAVAKFAVVVKTLDPAKGTLGFGVDVRAGLQTTPAAADQHREHPGIVNGPPPCPSTPEKAQPNCGANKKDSSTPKPTAAVTPSPPRPRSPSDLSFFEDPSDLTLLNKTPSPSRQTTDQSSTPTVAVIPEKRKLVSSDDDVYKEISRTRLEELKKIQRAKMDANIHAQRAATRRSTTLQTPQEVGVLQSITAESREPIGQPSLSPPPVYEPATPTKLHPSRMSINKPPTTPVSLSSLGPEKTHRAAGISLETSRSVKTGLGAPMSDHSRPLSSSISSVAFQTSPTVPSSRLLGAKETPIAESDTSGSDGSIQPVVSRFIDDDVDKGRTMRNGSMGSNRRMDSTRLASPKLPANSGESQGRTPRGQKAQALVSGVSTPTQISTQPRSDRDERPPAAPPKPLHSSSSRPSSPPVKATDPRRTSRPEIREHGLSSLRFHPRMPRPAALGIALPSQQPRSGAARDPVPPAQQPRPSGTRESDAARDPVPPAQQPRPGGTREPVPSSQKPQPGAARGSGVTHSSPQQRHSGRQSSPIVLSSPVKLTQANSRPRAPRATRQSVQESARPSPPATRPPPQAARPALPATRPPVQAARPLQPRSTPPPYGASSSKKRDPKSTTLKPSVQDNQLSKPVEKKARIDSGGGRPITLTPHPAPAPKQSRVYTDVDGYGAGYERLQDKTPFPAYQRPPGATSAIPNAPYHQQNWIRPDAAELAAAQKAGVRVKVPSSPRVTDRLRTRPRPPATGAAGVESVPSASGTQVGGRKRKVEEKAREEEIAEMERIEKERALATARAKRNKTMGRG